METLTGRGRLADRGRRLLAGASPKGHMDGNAGVAAGAPGRGGATNPADRMPLGKREGAGWRNPKVVRLEERRTQKGKATFFRSMSGRGLTDPRTSPCRLWGCPKKGIGGTIRNASSSPFSGDALCFIPKAAIRGVGRPPGKGGSLWHSSCLTSWPMYWPASLWRSLSAAFAARK